MNVDPTLEVLARYRTAARSIARRPGPLAGPRGRCLAIDRLARRLQEIDDLTVREWARKIVWSEVRELLGCPVPLIPEPRLPYGERVRLFVNAGHLDCPCCGRPLAPASLKEDA